MNIKANMFFHRYLLGMLLFAMGKNGTRLCRCDSVVFDGLRYYSLCDTTDETSKY